jgi:NADH-quinone oxidoreductase subunit N
MHDSVVTILPAAAVAAAALVVLLVDMFVRRKAVLAWVAAAGLVVAAALGVGQWIVFKGGLALDGRAAEFGFNNMVANDRYGLFFTLLFCVIGILTIMLSDAYLQARGRGQGEFYALLLLIISGMIGMAVATDVIVFFIAFELMSLPTYVLAGFLRTRSTSGEAAIKYFINGAFASAILVFGLALLYGVSGQSNYGQIGVALSHLGGRTGLSIMALVLITVGFAFKISAVPFHSWAPDVYEGAPTPVTAFMSVGIKAAAFAGFLKLLVLAAAPHWQVWTDALIILSIITMVVGNVLALPQRNLKRMLAYSSIAHAGYLALGVIAAGKLASGATTRGLLDGQGASAVLFYVAAYAFMNLGAFGLLVFIRNRRAFGYTLDEFAGLGRTMPWAAFAMMLFMVSLTGIPPTAGFWGKFYLFTAVVDAHYTWLAIIAVVMSAVSAYYYLRVVWYMYFREPVGEPQAALEQAGPSLGVSATLVVSAVAVMAIGLYPSPLITFAQNALRHVLG